MALLASRYLPLDSLGLGSVLGSNPWNRRMVDRRVIGVGESKGTIGLSRPSLAYFEVNYTKTVSASKRSYSNNRQMMRRTKKVFEPSVSSGELGVTDRRDADDRRAAAGMSRCHTCTHAGSRKALRVQSWSHRTLCPNGKIDMEQTTIQVPKEVCPHSILW